MADSGRREEAASPPWGWNFILLLISWPILTADLSQHCLECYILPIKSLQSSVTWWASSRPDDHTLNSLNYAITILQSRAQSHALRRLEHDLYSGLHSLHSHIIHCKCYVVYEDSIYQILTRKVWYVKTTMVGLSWLKIDQYSPFSGVTPRVSYFMKGFNPDYTLPTHYSASWCIYPTHSRITKNIVSEYHVIR